MNIKRLIRTFDLNKSIPPVMVGLVLEGIFILISLRVAENFLIASEYSQLTIVYSIISILSFGLFAGLEQIRQSQRTDEFSLNKTIRYALISLLCISPILLFILIQLKISILFSFLIFISAFSYAIQFDFFGYLSHIKKPYSYAGLKVLDAGLKIFLVFSFGSLLQSFFAIVFAYSLAPLVALLLYLRLSNLNPSYKKTISSKTKAYIDLSILNFISLSYLYGLPLVNYLKDNETIYTASNLFFGQAYSQVLQFTLAPIQFYFLPKLAKQYSKGENIKLSDIYRGFYMAAIVSIAYVVFTYIFGVRVITYFFYNSFNLDEQETILIAMISVLILLIKTSSFYLIAIRKTELLGYTLLSSFLLLGAIVYFTQLNITFAFLLTCSFSLLIIFYLNIKLITDDQ